MAKEFDIYLNKRLTECDIIVYSIPYRDGLTAMNRIILESCLESYTLYKFVAAQTSSELTSRIDEMIKTCYERLNWGMNVSVTAEFQTHYSLRPGSNVIELGMSDIASTASVFASAENALQINAAPLLAFIGKSGGRGSSEIELDSNLQDILKQSVLTISPGVEIGAGVRSTFEQKLIQADAPLVFSAELANLCYRITCAADTAIQVAASVLGTEFHYSLGYGESGIVLHPTVFGEQMTKFMEVNSALHILSSVTEAIIQFMTPNYGSIQLQADVEPILKRFRMLGEMDDDALSAYDDMTLEEIDYVIL